MTPRTSRASRLWSTVAFSATEQLPGGDRLRWDQQLVEHLVGPFDVPLTVAKREGEMAGEECVDPEPAELAQRGGQRLQPAIVRVLQEDPSTVKHDVAREQLRLPPCSSRNER